MTPLEPIELMQIEDFIVLSGHTGNGLIQDAVFNQFLCKVSDNNKQFAIRGCKEDAPNALPFSKPQEQQKNPIQVHLGCCGGYDPQDGRVGCR